MNLVIDGGNTFIKTAVFQNNRLLEKQVFLKKDFFENFENLQKKFPAIRKSILSSVTSLDSDLENALKKSYSLLQLDDLVALPFKNEYATPHTLGKDRIALVAAAVNTYPGKNVLIIDAGTCITYDLKTEDEVYLGGAISPGLEMRFKSLHKFTANLPLVTPKPAPKLIGDSTESSILSGIINGIEMELKGTIKSYDSKFEDLTIIFTGGDSQILSIPLKNSIFANSNFLLEGLNFILEFNKTQ
ncbi:type III pantothenate kinase [Christiangramia forsetii]|uniref:Type III pantothenate kinase n=2 Tax=Christiangramia forsetii TaxID=411153 RepID=COAX_CHRFK|nr:type III pantothenate kinase [Christiangramia forsetii]A0M5N3.1 RecName: Full=Type III pantothenate kinase; AltName: Full=PanK-III; AltName: Full=Pantothenic acid kinase [Christiangramia forsetii KT0803]GGG32544.1 type III pantothenate kinase [Christiangramia forsetii]CAL67928.1 transcription regulator [Christiangramia forsetii KT0803]